MGKETEICWAESTFNPWHGCAKVSEGCTHCYAETFSRRIGYSETGSKFPIWGVDAERRHFADKHWDEPLKWNAAAAKLGVMHRVFCGSMCDILEDRPDTEDPRRATFRLVPKTPNLLWLFLTKRPENALDLFPQEWAGNGNWPRNAMFGVTIENQKRLNERMPYVEKFTRSFPGVQMFASCEPLLSALDWDHEGDGYGPGWLQYFDWVIGGGESGPGARPMHPDWIRKLRDDCDDRTDMGRPWPVQFLFKQWGEYHPLTRTDGIHESPFGGQHMMKVGKKEAGRTLDGRTWDGVPHLSYGPQLPGVENYGACEVRNIPDCNARL